MGNNAGHITHASDDAVSVGGKTTPADPTRRRRPLFFLRLRLRRAHPGKSPSSARLATLIPPASTAQIRRPHGMGASNYYNLEGEVGPAAAKQKRVAGGSHTLAAGEAAWSSSYATRLLAKCVNVVRQTRRRVRPIA